MSWISTNNLRRFADKLFHGNLSFGGSVTHNGATTFNGGVKVNTTKAEFAAPVSFTGTTTYKGNEIATKADIVAGGGNITVDDTLSDTSTNPVQNKVITERLNKTLPASSSSGRRYIAWTSDETLDIRFNDGVTQSSTNISPGSIYCKEHEGPGLRITGMGIVAGNPIIAENGNVHYLIFGEKLIYCELDDTEGSIAARENIATEAYVEANYVPLSNGHISINGSELWIE